MKYLGSKLSIPVGIVVIIFMIAILVLVSNQSNNDKDFLDKYNLSNLTTQQIVTKLDQITDEDDAFYAAITGKQLTLGDENNEFEYNVPKGKFYLSLAPYINSTHPCGNHNLVTCRGELKNETMNIVVKDTSGKVIVDGDYTSYNNGFIGLWLPSNISGTITVSYLGLTATSEISTSPDSNTCLTTLKLS